MHQEIYQSAFGTWGFSWRCFLPFKRNCSAWHDNLPDALIQATNDGRLGESEKDLIGSTNRAANDAKHAYVYPPRISDINGGPQEERWTTAIVCAPATSVFWAEFDNLMRRRGNEERVTVKGVGDCLMRRRWPPTMASGASRQVSPRDRSHQPRSLSPLPPPWGAGRASGASRQGSRRDRSRQPRSISPLPPPWGAGRSHSPRGMRPSSALPNPRDSGGPVQAPIRANSTARSSTAAGCREPARVERDSALASPASNSTALEANPRAVRNCEICTREIGVRLCPGCQRGKQCWRTPGKQCWGLLEDAVRNCQCERCSRSVGKAMLEDAGSV